MEADGTDPGGVVSAPLHFHRTGDIFPPGPDLQTLDELAASLAEKGQTVLARRKLIIETAYGRREFPLEEVRSAVVAEGTHQEDILQLLKEITL